MTRTWLFCHHCGEKKELERTPDMPGRRKLSLVLEDPRTKSGYYGHEDLKLEAQLCVECFDKVLADPELREADARSDARMYDPRPELPR